MGKKCMYIFLLHGVVIGVVDKIYNNSITNPGIYMLLVVTLTLVISIITEYIVRNIKIFWYASMR